MTAGWVPDGAIRAQVRSCRVGSGSGAEKCASPGPDGKKCTHAVLYSSSITFTVYTHSALFCTSFFFSSEVSGFVTTHMFYRVAEV
jgi:hypothetical protein